MDPQSHHPPSRSPLPVGFKLYASAQRGSDKHFSASAEPAGLVAAQAKKLEGFKPYSAHGAMGIGSRRRDCHLMASPLYLYQVFQRG